MNVEQLIELAARIASFEKHYEVQAKLQNLGNYFSNLASSPGNESYQQQVSSSLDELNKAMRAFEALLTPREKLLLRTLSPEDFFSSKLVSSIREQVSENPATPAVVVSFIQQLIDRRLQWLVHLSNLKNSLDAFGVGYQHPEFPIAEVGFLIPRNIFKNDFSPFIKEIEVVKFIVDSAALVSTGAAQEIELSQLATSDPYVILGVDFRVVAAIGAFVTWSLNTWKQVLEIRELRDKAKSIDSVSEFAEMLDQRIGKIIDERIKEETARLMAEHDRKGGDLEARLSRALHMLLERVERGYQVDLRLPPAVKDGPNEEELKPIRTLRNSLLFPEATETPILKLTSEMSASRPKPNGK